MKYIRPVTKIISPAMYIGAADVNNAAATPDSMEGPALASERRLWLVPNARP